MHSALQAVSGDKQPLAARLVERADGLACGAGGYAALQHQEKPVLLPHHQPRQAVVAGWARGASALLCCLRGLVTRVALKKLHTCSTTRRSTELCLMLSQHLLRPCRAWVAADSPLSGKGLATIACCSEQLWFRGRRVPSAVQCCPAHAGWPAAERAASSTCERVAGHAGARLQESTGRRHAPARLPPHTKPFSEWQPAGVFA